MKIYVIGDSISLHYGPCLERLLQGFCDYERKGGEAEARLNLDQPLGANGGDSRRVLSFLRASAAAGTISADRLLFNCGLHDIKREPATGRVQVPLGEYEKNLRDIVAVIREMECAPAWIRTTPCDENAHNRTGGPAFHRFRADCDAWNEAADRVMADLEVPAIDLHGFTLNLGPDLYCDHVHFHQHIREKQAAFIAGWLTAGGERR